MIKLLMIMDKKYILIISLLVICSIETIAQTSYYYYKGNKMPLTIDNSKVCMSIPKNKKGICKELLKDVQILDTIRDTVFDISIVRQSDYKRLSASNSWKKEAVSILLSSCYRTKGNKEVCLTPYLSVRLKKTEDFNLLSLYAEKYGLRIVRNSSLMPLWYILSISPDSGMNSLEVANALWESGDFAASEPDLSFGYKAFCSNDPKFNEQWGLYNGTTPDIDISICNAWNYATGKNVKIAIVDSGVDYYTVDLEGNISNLSFDTESQSSPSLVYSDHGTRCASIAAAKKDNHRDIAGVAPDATIIPISTVTNGYTAYFSYKMACGIRWAYEHGADIISCSWGFTPEDTAIDEAIQDAFEFGRNGKGCVVVFATGNDSINSVSYPANSNDTILAIGSINQEGGRAKSNYGLELDLVAPGDSIWSIGQYNRLFKGNGTSWACPHVAGVAALVLQRNPDLTVTQVNSIICRNAKKLPGVSFNETKTYGAWNEQYGYGLVDAYSSVINTPNIEYIQNDTITGIRTISADKIYIGRDVTDQKEYGDVTLGPGNIKLKAEKVLIKNSTKVTLGTKLKIGN